MIIHYEVTDVIRAEHEYSPRGSQHRIVLRFEGGEPLVGLWTYYKSIARLEHDGMIYEAATDYHGERLVRVVPARRLPPEAN